MRTMILAVGLGWLAACGGGGGGTGACEKLWDKHLSALGGEGYGKAVRANLMKACPKLSAAEISCLDEHGFRGAWTQSPCCTAHAKIIGTYFDQEWGTKDCKK